MDITAYLGEKFPGLNGVRTFSRSSVPWRADVQMSRHYAGTELVTIDLEQGLLSMFVVGIASARRSFGHETLRVAH